jgi:hypothetical protein
MKKKRPSLVRIMMIVLIGSSIILWLTFILNTGIGTSASVFKAEKCSSFAFMEHSDYLGQSVEILLSAKIYIEISDEYSPGTIAYQLNDLAIEQEGLSYPECVKQLQEAQVRYLQSQSKAFTAKAKGGFFSPIIYRYYRLRAENYLNLTILIETIIMPSVPSNDIQQYNVNLNIYRLGRDPF